MLTPITQYASKLFQISVQYKANIVFLFRILYLIMGVLFVLAWQAYGASEQFIHYEYIGAWSATVAVCAFVLTLLPGIFRRFNIRHPLIQLVMLFRRQIGLLMFFLAAFHGYINRILPTIMAHEPGFPQVPLYEFFGMITVNVLLLPLALTSNDWSVRTMGRWWKRVHMFSYIAAWTIFIHLFLAQISFWTLLIGCVAVAEPLSYLYAWRKQKMSNAATQQNLK